MYENSWMLRTNDACTNAAKPKLPMPHPRETDHLFVDDSMNRPQHQSSVTSSRLVSGVLGLHQPELHGAGLRRGQLSYHHLGPNLV